MHFIPYNRHLVIDLIEEEEKIDESVIVLPSDYEKPQSFLSEIPSDDINGIIK